LERTIQPNQRTALEGRRQNKVGHGGWKWKNIFVHTLCLGHVGERQGPTELHWDWSKTSRCEMWACLLLQRCGNRRKSSRQGTGETGEKVVGGSSHFNSKRKKFERASRGKCELGGTRKKRERLYHKSRKDDVFEIQPISRKVGKGLGDVEKSRTTEVPGKIK